MVALDTGGKSTKARLIPNLHSPVDVVLLSQVVARTPSTMHYVPKLKKNSTFELGYCLENEGRMEIREQFGLRTRPGNVPAGHSEISQPEVWLYGFNKPVLR